MAIKVDYDPETAVARELVLRLASLLWRLRRARRGTCFDADRTGERLEAA
jgi:hypothetical protein